MITILHGDNTIKSRQKLVDMISQAKDKGVKIKRLDAKRLSPAELEENLASSDLFGNERLVVVEALHSLPRSKRKNRLIELLTDAVTNVCLWEKRELTKNMVKKFKGAKVHKFKLSNSLFDWLDSISPLKQSKAKQIRLLRKAVEANDEYVCFAMLARQVRLLIQAKDGGKISAPPFVIRKINRQASRFSLRQLLDLHAALHRLDFEAKTSNNLVDLQTSLESLMLNL